MNRIMLTLAVISIAALIVATIALSETLLISQNQQHPTPASSTQQPTIASPTLSPRLTTSFNPALTAEPLFNNGIYPAVSIPANRGPDETSLSYNDLRILPGNSYNYLETTPNGTVILSSNSVNGRLINGVYTFQFSVTLTNPATSMNSSRPYAFQFVVTRVDSKTIAAQDIELTVVVQNAFNPVGAMFGERPTYNYVNLTANMNANELTYLCNPNVTENLQAAGGSIITSGFEKTLEMTISFAAIGTYNLSIKLLPA
jgi:hypothetical protein